MLILSMVWELPVRGKGNFSRNRYFPSPFWNCETNSGEDVSIETQLDNLFKTGQEGPIYFLSEKEVLASFPSSLANWPTWNMGGGVASHVSTPNWLPVP
jgi:hypothetical protein